MDKWNASVQEFVFLNEVPPSPKVQFDPPKYVDRSFNSKTSVYFDKDVLRGEFSRYVGSLLCDRSVMEGSVTVILTSRDSKLLDKVDDVVRMSFMGVQANYSVQYSKSILYNGKMVAVCLYKLCSPPVGDTFKILVSVGGELVQQCPLTITLIPHEEYWDRIHQVKFKEVSTNLYYSRSFMRGAVTLLLEDVDEDSREVMGEKLVRMRLVDVEGECSVEYRTSESHTGVLAMFWYKLSSIPAGDTFPIIISVGNQILHKNV